MNTPAVSVCVFTYNYQSYLSEAIESILLQKTNFEIEILICDDCSTDNTFEIALSYAEKYPEKVRAYQNPTNIGGTKNWIKAIQACKGKYIALLDGDDYFSDSLKLQTQYDTMENNDKYVLCFHSVDEIYDDAPELNKTVEFQNEIYSLSDFMLNGWFVRTSSTFFKNGVIPQIIPDWVHEYPYRFDTILHVFLCLHGDAFNVKKSMSVWRKHKKGMSFWLMTNMIENTQKKILLSRKLNDFVGGQYKTESRKFISNEKTLLFFYLLRNFIFWKHPLVFIDSFLNLNFKLFLKLLKGKRHGIKNA
jgi:glycosyltransferase involved in cell wall biosynthesis